MGRTVTYNKGPNPFSSLKHNWRSQITRAINAQLGPAGFSSRPSSGKDGVRQRRLPQKSKCSRASKAQGSNRNIHTEITALLPVQFKGALPSCLVAEPGSHTRGRNSMTRLLKRCLSFTVMPMTSFSPVRFEWRSFI